MPAKSPVILWFRDDLRLADQAAVREAVESGHPVIPLFILDDSPSTAWGLGAASRWWLHFSLTALQRALLERGSGLVLRRGNTVDVLAALVQEVGASAIFTGITVEPSLRRNEAEAAERLQAAGCVWRRFCTTTLFHPDLIRTKTGTPYTVFTPFANACRAAAGFGAPNPAPSAIPAARLPASETLQDWALLPTTPDWAGGLRDMWTPGEAAAQERATAFLEQGFGGYALARERPFGDGTSMLSAHLHFGEISVVSLWYQAHAQPDSKSRETLLRELLWREFCRNLLWHHSGLPDEPLRSSFARMPWREDSAALRAWQRGRTGVPIVDAGMRQLWQTGWMHNRVRMITASFLVKHLLLSWQSGEAWFWDTLVDADLANNATNWQWIAGCGADASPFFRIFNPVLQGRKFDPDGDYVRHFVPELARVPARHIHAPWEAPDRVLASAGVALGATYPRPIVALGAARDRALAVFRSLRQPA